MIELLAKGVRGGRRPLSLHQHLRDADDAAQRLFRAGSRWAEAFLRFFKLAPSDHPRFLLHLRVAALFHDLGKANQSFLDAVRAPGYQQQLARHEHLSALVLAHADVAAWLSRNPDLDQDTIIAAVLSHHLKASLSGEHQVLADKGQQTIPFYLAHPQVEMTLRDVASVAGLDGPLPKLPTTYGIRDRSWDQAFRDLLEFRWSAFDGALRRDPQRRAFCLAVKAGLIAADSVASAMFREGFDQAQWIEEVAHAAALSADDIDRGILTPRTDEVSRKLGRPFQYHPFQAGAADIGDRAVLLAGCGMGKTLAAWRWAESVARRRPIGRVMFLYPTRGTATEGFRDYVGHAPEGTAKLVHGAAAYALRGMLANPDEARPASLRGKNLAPDETEDRLFSLGLWSKRYFSATVDQFLGFIQHDYRGLCLLPSLADSAIIFDEVHSYDNIMWQALVDFLGNFDVPALCMTATLPEGRRRRLSSCVPRFYPNAAEATQLTELADLEGHDRYQLEPVADAEVAFQLIAAAAKPGTRILWVVNTVRRCQTIAARLARELDVDVLVYHSRFKLEHREERHRQTIQAFQTSQDRPIVAVTTQVCEMSLDLDADVLVTEHAPVSSLVQRFGRANRHLRRGRDFRARLLTYRPESVLPYSRDDLDAAERFLAALASGATSQRRLADALLAHSPRQPATPEDASQFLNGGYFATRAPFRDADESSAQAVLDRDRDAVVAALDAREPIDGFLVPVPRKHAKPGPHADLPPWLGLADARRYSPRYGFIVDDDLLGLVDLTEDR